MEEDQEESQINFIPCLCIVKRGVAKENPEKVSKITKKFKLKMLRNNILFIGYSYAGGTGQSYKRNKKGT